MNTGPVQPNLRLAQAYALASSRAIAGPAPLARAGAVQDVAEISSVVAPAGRDGARPRTPSPKLASLVAARVSSPALSPLPSRFAAGDALPLYTNPALRNAAATGVSLGQSLDVQG